MKYNRSTCPKPTEWFVHGGRCGWAHCCTECADCPSFSIPEPVKEKVIGQCSERPAACRDCWGYSGSDGVQGWCHAGHPVAVDGKGYGVWPKVNGGDWCLEFKGSGRAW